MTVGAAILSLMATASAGAAPPTFSGIDQALLAPRPATMAQFGFTGLSLHRAEFPITTLQ
jgi:hypothetical protein